MINGHGGNVDDLAGRLGCSIDDITDMSSNLNPLGPPGGLETFLKENIHAVRSLPRADAGGMVEAFARYLGIDPGRVMAANGTTWFLYTLPMALKSRKVLILGPTYADYRDGCVMHGVPFTFLMARSGSGFTPDFDAVGTLLEQDPRLDTVVVCNPNNPTGALVGRADLLDLAGAFPGVRFVVDESYLPFVMDAESITLAAETGVDNLIVLSSMSKIFRIAGLRTGFLCAPPLVIARFMAYYQPWSVNSLAQAAVVHLLEMGEELRPFIDRTRRFVIEEKARFEESLQGVDGLRLFPSETYFILAELTSGLRSAGACRFLADRRILIRDCANFEGLTDRYIRFSLKTREENQRLASLLRKMGGACAD